MSETPLRQSTRIKNQSNQAPNDSLKDDFHWPSTQKSTKMPKDNKQSSQHSPKKQSDKFKSSAKGQSSQQQTVKQQTTKETPKRGQSAKKEPKKGQSAKEEPKRGQSAKKKPKKGQSAKKKPTRGQSAKKPPTKRDSTNDALTQDTSPSFTGQMPGSRQTPSPIPSTSSGTSSSSDSSSNSVPNQLPDYSAITPLETRSVGICIPSNKPIHRDTIQLHRRGEASSKSGLHYHGSYGHGLEEGHKIRRNNYSYYCRSNVLGLPCAQTIEEILDISNCESGIKLLCKVKEWGIETFIEHTDFWYFDNAPQAYLNYHNYHVHHSTGGRSHYIAFINKLSTLSFVTAIVDYAKGLDSWNNKSHVEAMREYMRCPDKKTSLDLQGILQATTDAIEPVTTVQPRNLERTTVLEAIEEEEPENEHFTEPTQPLGEYAGLTPLVEHERTTIGSQGDEGNQEEPTATKCSENQEELDAARTKQTQVGTSLTTN